MYDGDRVAILIDGDDSPTVVDGVFAPRERIKIVSDVVPSTSQVGKKKAAEHNFSPYRLFM